MGGLLYRENIPHAGQPTRQREPTQGLAREIGQGLFIFPVNTAYLDGFSVRPCGEADSVDGTFTKGVSSMEMPQIFENKEFGKIRVVEHSGAPWFVANDICAILEIDRTQTRRLDDDEKGVALIDTPGGKQEMSIISEPGLYSLVLRSRKPEAKAFKRWIVHEVLPAIRKHGGYLTPKKLEEALLNPDVLIRLATQLKEEREARVQAEARVACPKNVYDNGDRQRAWDAQCRGPEPFAVRAAYPVQAERNLRPVRRVCRAWLCPHQAGNPRKRQDRVPPPMDAARKGMAPGHARLKKVPATRLGGDFFHMSIMNPKAPDP